MLGTDLYTRPYLPDAHDGTPYSRVPHSNYDNNITVLRRYIILLIVVEGMLDGKYKDPCRVH